MSNKVYQLARALAEELDELTDGKFIARTGDYRPHHLENLVGIQFVDGGREGGDTIWKVYGYNDQLFRITGYIDSWGGSEVYTSFTLVKSKVVMKFEYSVLEESDLA